MNLYNIDAAIRGITDALVDPETGEILEDEFLENRLAELAIAREEVLDNIAREVINTRAQSDAIKQEIERLKKRQATCAAKEEQLMRVLKNGCGGQKTVFSVGTVSYRNTDKTIVSDTEKAVKFLSENGYDKCVRIPKPAPPEVDKNEAKKLLKAGVKIPGCALESSVSCTLK